jgi:hypothetical protein
MPYWARTTRLTPIKPWSVNWQKLRIETTFCLSYANWIGVSPSGGERFRIRPKHVSRSVFHSLETFAIIAR